MKKQDIFNAIEQRQDFTYCKDLKRYVIGTTNIYTGQGVPENITVVIANSLIELERSEQMTFGGWLDTDTNLYYLDLGFSMNCKETAIALAKCTKQICIYDMVKNEVITIKK